MLTRPGILLLEVLTLALTAPAMAQWSPDPLQNLAIAAKVDTQARPRARMLSDGSCYASWLDNDPTGTPAFGYDVFLERLDVGGAAQWVPGGVRIADRGFSDAGEYGLDADAAGNALLAFNDDRSGVEQITATKVSSSGTQLWGATGVQVSSGTGGKSFPGIAATTDGNEVVAWSGSGRKGSAVELVKLGSTGATLWSVSIAAPRGASHDFSHIVSSGSGSVIVSWVLTDAAQARHLIAQKYSTKGRPMWGKGVVIFDGGSLPAGEFPAHVSDGAGGAAFGWSSAAPIEVYAQHVAADGTETFPHNGVAAATDGVPRTNPSVAYDPIPGHTVLIYREGDGPGGGVYGQRFVANGLRLWRSSGAEIVPVGTYFISSPTAVVTGSGRTLVLWILGSNPSEQRIYGAVLGVTAEYVCTSFDVATLGAGKNRLVADVTPSGNTILLWEDGRNDASDIFGQRVAADCSLGGAAIEGSAP